MATLEAPGECGGRAAVVMGEDGRLGEALEPNRGEEGGRPEGEAEGEPNGLVLGALGGLGGLGGSVSSSEV